MPPIGSGSACLMHFPLGLQNTIRLSCNFCIQTSSHIALPCAPSDCTHYFNLTSWFNLWEKTLLLPTLLLSQFLLPCITLPSSALTFLISPVVPSWQLLVGALLLKCVLCSQGSLKLSSEEPLFPVRSWLRKPLALPLVSPMASLCFLSEWGNWGSEKGNDLPSQASKESHGWDEPEPLGFQPHVPFQKADCLSQGSGLQGGSSSQPLLAPFCTHLSTSCLSCFMSTHQSWPIRVSDSAVEAKDI